MWRSRISVTDCRITDDEHSSDNQCDGLPTDCVTGVFGSSGRGDHPSGGECLSLGGDHV